MPVRFPVLLAEWDAVTERLRPQRAAVIAVTQYARTITAALEMAITGVVANI